MHTIIRQPAVQRETGLSRSTQYELQAAGLFVPPVRIGPRAVGWPLHEVRAVNAARIAGKSDAEVRALVRRLVEKRRELAGAAA